MQPELLDDPNGRRVEAAARSGAVKRWRRDLPVRLRGGASCDGQLFNQTRAIYVNDPVKREHFTKQIAFNDPRIFDIFMDDGSTKEEWKWRRDPQDPRPRYCGHGDLRADPVFIGHGEAINVEFERPLARTKRAPPCACTWGHGRRPPAPTKAM